MTEDRKKQIEQALESYTQKVTSSPEAAKAALEKSGIYQPDGQLSPQYRERAETE